MSVETNENSVKENSTEPKKKKKLSKQQRNYIFYIILIVFVSALSIYYIVKMILTKLYVPSQKPKSVQY